MVVASNPVGAHFVGSICLDSTDEVFSTISKTLPNHAPRIPDGETGDRYNWVSFQIKVFEHVKRLQRTADSGFDHNVLPRVPDDEAIKMIGELHPGYAKLALESYAIFAQKKKEGVIPKHIKFQVSIPTPIAGVQRGVTNEYAPFAEGPYEEGIYRDLREIQDKIPHSELSIQWDIAIEIMILEGAYQSLQETHDAHHKFGYTGPWWSDDKQGIKDGVYERLVRYASHGHVDDDVEMGFHLCYGDFTHKHFVEPKDAGLLAEMSEILLNRVDRKIDYIHLPVPKDRLDAPYYQPLAGIASLVKKNGTTLYLGVVHGKDREGSEARVATAQRVLGENCRWGVATECGIGRTPRDELPGILETLKAVSNPVVPVAA